MRSFIVALRTSLFLMILCGLLYPLATTAVAQVLFHKQAEGSLVIQNGKVQGSELLAQGFKGPEWFHPRASAAKYDPTASAATNAAVASNEYVKTVKDNVNQLKKENGNIGNKIPADLVTTSGSGFDPDLSLEAAKAQVPRIAKALSVSEDRLQALINEHTIGRSFGIFGEPRVNVLELNMALQQLK
ncbi:Potassium-transporting ATPase KdpC subunit [Neobacillus rhizosphaerae]|uniref:Potassium-transporting ATPase KdpC subunit n=1 Tax=Neobacillus rhizosphaerae TaxID=2880965 RepID=A0ABM9EV71_9BACI|nr:potassium-transporting ATPase subunit KdpC [Neobacillus rhizosphaerae]CAH2716578.1 Potassium-transporting ATPase KdpC subunit [Neobacillus rhizosphaerae]